MAISTALIAAFVVIQPTTPSAAQDVSTNVPETLEAILPSPQVHPLPPSLEQWQDANLSGDYFDAIQPTALGYLIWSEFPVKVYVEALPSPDSAEFDRANTWITAVTQAVQEWAVYLPLITVDTADIADISIWRSPPPLQVGDRRSDRTAVPSIRARSAETRYEFAISRTETGADILSHRFNILLRPNQTATYITAAARHELGHALGIWGHSSLETDALYFSQVRNPPSISARDVNTLKRIYEQPTRLGWAMRDRREG